MLLFIYYIDYNITWQFIPTLSSWLSRCNLSQKQPLYAIFRRQKQQNALLALGKSQNIFEISVVQSFIGSIHRPPPSLESSFSLMFTREDLSSIDTSYFKLINTGCFVIVLQSRNTKHYWALQSGSEYTSCEILHKHGAEGSYHIHGRAKNLADAIGQIRRHDQFQLQGRKK